MTRFNSCVRSHGSHSSVIRQINHISYLSPVVAWLCFFYFYFPFAPFVTYIHVIIVERKMVFWKKTVSNITYSLSACIRYQRIYVLTNKINIPSYDMDFGKFHVRLVTPCGDWDLSSHLVRLWLGAIEHQAITWTSVDVAWLGAINVMKSLNVHHFFHSNLYTYSTPWLMHYTPLQC